MRHSIEYNIGSYRISINYWFLIIFLLLQTGLNELGFWQIERAQEKQLFLAKINQQESDKRLNLETVTAVDVKNFSLIKLAVSQGSLKPILLENIIQNGKLGYQVLNLVTEPLSGKKLLINRGWINGKANRNRVPHVEAAPADWQISGRLVPINQPLLSAQAEIEEFPEVMRIPVLDLSIVGRLENKYSVTIEPYLVRLDDKSQGHFNIGWNWVNMLPEKHLGYAFQWFALSFTLLIISLFALIKKDPAKNDN